MNTMFNLLCEALEEIYNWCTNDDEWHCPYWKKSDASVDMRIYTYHTAMCRTLHEVPDPSDVSARYFCEDAEHHAVWCDACSGDGWRRSNRFTTPFSHEGGYICDPGDHDMGWCGGCEELYDVDDMRYNDYTDESYCNHCYPEQQHSADCWEGQSVRTCGECNSRNLHLDLLSEEFLCDCKVRTRLAADGTHPIVFSYPLPELVNA